MTLKDQKEIPLCPGKPLETDPKIALGTTNRLENKMEGEYGDEADEDAPFEKRRYGVYLDDEVKLIMDRKVYGDNNIIQGRYLSMTDDRVALLVNEDKKVHWVSIDCIIDIVCLFHRRPIPTEPEKKEDTHSMFG